jgi:hypothetical protein
MHRHTAQINVHLPRGLHRVGVENNAALIGHAGHLPDREEDAGFIVGPDHGDDRRVGAQRLQVGGKINTPAGIDRQPCHLAPLARQLLAKIFRRAVFNRGSDDVPFPRLRGKGSAQCRVDRLRAPAGENHRIFRRPEESRHLRPGLLQRPARHPARGMRTRRVAELMAEKRQHGFTDPRVGRRGRVVVEVDHGKIGETKAES